MLPAFTLWWRELVRFYRQRARVVGVIASPLLFWVVIGSGFGSSFRSGDAAGQQHYLDYFYPGALIMIVLFTSIFTMMSVIEDRKEGFLLSVLVAPVPRSAIVLGKVLGGTTLSAIQGLIFLAFAPLVGMHLGLTSFLLVVLTVFLVSFALTALGFTIAWSMDSTQAFHAIINLFLIPLWLLSGALFPLAGASGWIRFLIRINPLTYGVEALRDLLYPGSAGSFSAGLIAGDAGAVLRSHVRPFVHHGQPPHHQTRRMMQVPAQYAIYPVIDAVLNGTSAVLLLVGRSYIKRGRMAAHRAVMITALISSALFLTSYLVLSLARGLGALSGTRLVAPGLFHDPDFTHHTGGRHRAPGNHYAEPRAARAFRPASQNRALDVSAVAVCIGDRCGDLLDAVSPVRSLTRRHGENSLCLIHGEWLMTL